MYTIRSGMKTQCRRVLHFIQENMCHAPFLLYTKHTQVSHHQFLITVYVHVNSQRTMVLSAKVCNSHCRDMIPSQSMNTSMLSYILTHVDEKHIHKSLES